MCHYWKLVNFKVVTVSLLHIKPHHTTLSLIIFLELKDLKCVLLLSYMHERKYRRLESRYKILETNLLLVSHFHYISI